ncbi:Uncharacterised protein [Kingella potus]|uniref:Uncharacterized protein n=1 Tax=Kingella potus TaxID=265175 RepID=A0A377R084_9NEIS|nr:hypothetical protein [Kingella potus]UOP00994.1 hypothetical protein LVJ84_00895 [Kingella potus]STR00662.1 Uncharacterised protein [Kingella potus]
MTSSGNVKLPEIPAKRYFSLAELCELAQISAAQFAQWQYEHGTVVGYGADKYTRADVVKIRKLKDTFAPFVDGFNHNGLDAEGHPAATAEEVGAALGGLLAKIEKALA